MSRVNLCNGCRHGNCYQHTVDFWTPERGIIDCRCPLRHDGPRSHMVHAICPVGGDGFSTATKYDPIACCEYVQCPLCGRRYYDRQKNGTYLPEVIGAKPLLVLGG